MRKRSLNKDLALKLMMTAGFGLAIALSACATASKPLSSLRSETAQHIAGAAHLMPAYIPVGEFTLLSYERVSQPGKPITVYIDGDGAQHSDLSWNGDPTPVNPVALRMAADDATPNVIYLGRPCQFTKITAVRACTQALYTTHRYSPQVLDAMNAALENIKKRFDAPSFDLVGYEGGAAIAVEMAAVRGDVKSLKTVAGILDTRVMAEGERTNPYAGSLNPLDAASKVAGIPQTHSVASWDKVRSLEMIHNFVTAEGSPATATMGAPAPTDDAPDQVAAQPVGKVETAPGAPQPLNQ